jgi:hypothetical protein
MTPVWAQRKEELLSDCLVSPEVFNPLLDRLGDFVVPYQHALEAEAGQGVSGCVKMLGNGRFENAGYKSEEGDRRKHLLTAGEPGNLRFSSRVGLSCGNFCLR